LIGILGIASGVFGFLAIKEPKRGRFEEKKKVTEDQTQI
jgi:hypothetical protein